MINKARYQTKIFIFDEQTEDVKLKKISKIAGFKEDKTKIILVFCRAYEACFKGLRDKGFNIINWLASFCLACTVFVAPTALRHFHQAALASL